MRIVNIFLPSSFCVLRKCIILRILANLEFLIEAVNCQILFGDVFPTHKDCHSQISEAILCGEGDILFASSFYMCVDRNSCLG